MKGKHVHFVGIGGIGMSSLAHIMLKKGYQVTGCDINSDQETVSSLKAAGCVIETPHGSACCFDDSIDMMVYSTDTRHPMPEKDRALRGGAALKHRAELLADIMSQKQSIAISGAHGKTSTTAMIGHLLQVAHADPTVVVGGICPQWKTNFMYGKSNIMIAEADESDRSFLKLPAQTKIVTNIDHEHLETYSSLQDRQATFLQFLNSNNQNNSTHVICVDDPSIQQIRHLIDINYVTYAIDNKADFYAKNIDLQPLSSSFDLYVYGQCVARCTLAVPGKHMLLNALGALAAARMFSSVSYEYLVDGLKSFCPVERRFTIRGSFHHATVIDDYAHHPQEIAVTIQTACNFAKGRTFVFFQPHRFTRTAGLWDQFVQTFRRELANAKLHFFMTTIYSAGEPEMSDVSTERMVKEIDNGRCAFIENRTESIIKALPNDLSEDDTILFMGAGNVSKHSTEIFAYQ
ncbi:UDP-N-acetylmuramate--L-alanine ligase [bacterium]|nr:MAG: UDP-N-acetylmuramate--L-alanine ligase [bacterium]QQR61755.1 MAG: UDP-N-acetylmuramate--L-alanine ligase [bacterium]QQR62671.1 MAG: UDP-N-acetylmuramate--L-alanine ligase [bacterium]